MNKTILSLLFLLSTLTFVKCDRCRQKKLSDKKFTQEELNVAPYNGFEELIFRDSIGNSIYFTGQGRTSTMQLIHETWDWDGEECPGDNRQVERVDFSFNINHSTDTTLLLSLLFIHPFNEYENDKYIRFAFDNIGFSGIYSFEAGIIMNPKYPAWSDSYIPAFYDTLTIFNKTFYSVFELKNNYYGNEPNDLLSVYYSISRGIIGFKKGSGTTWYLD
jgi:hypothetical protein